MKKIIKSLIPPLVLKNINSSRSPWKGDYETWSEAEKLCTGYSEKGILEKVSNATEKVANGKAPYERDSVLFKEASYSWPLVAALLSTYNKSGFLNVMDFGGSLGSSYFQNRIFIKNLPKTTWTVVEQDHFVSEGESKFQTNVLNFHRSMEDTFEAKAINFVLLSSVLQYLEDPYGILNLIINKKPDVIFLDRLSIVETERDIITIQQVPASIYKASYPCRFFNEENIIRTLSTEYNLFSRFPSFVENKGTLNYRYQFEDIGQYWVKK